MNNFTEWKFVFQTAAEKQARKLPDPSKTISSVTKDKVESDVLKVNSESDSLPKPKYLYQELSNYKKRIQNSTPSSETAAAMGEPEYIQQRRREINKLLPSEDVALQHHISSLLS